MLMPDLLVEQVGQGGKAVSAVLSMWDLYVGRQNYAKRTAGREPDQRITDLANWQRSRNGLRVTYPGHAEPGSVSAASERSQVSRRPD